MDIYIITWNKFQHTQIHDHSENGCIMKLLQGQLYENIYNNELKPEKNTLLVNGDVSFIKNNMGYHSIFNKENQVAVSIHVYNPPNHKINYFNELN
jgi:cysteine dioxygenase